VGCDCAVSDEGSALPSLLMFMGLLLLLRRRR